MGKRDAYLEYLANVPMFSTCTKQELQAIARRATDVTLAEGDTIVREGETGYEFFVIVQGKVRVTRGGEDVATLGAGDFFGELSLLHRQPRNASVTASSAVDAVVLSSQEFDAVLEEAPTLTRRLLEGLARRLAELDTRA